MDCYVWCVSWYDNNNERHIKWDVADPDLFEKKLIDEGVDPSKIDVYEKDVS